MKSEDTVLLHHKLDVIMWRLLGRNVSPSPPRPIPGCGGQTDAVCPFCQANVYLNVDPIKGEINRQCGCSTGLISTGPSPILTMSPGNLFSVGGNRDD